MQLTGCHFLQETCATCFWSSLMFILVINQLDAQNLFYSKFISCLYIFRAPCAHRQEVKIVLYSLWYHHTEKSKWSKISKIYKYEHIVVDVQDLPQSLCRADQSNLKSRFREHIRYIKNNDSCSAYALHILNCRHEYGNISDTMTLLTQINTPTLLLPYEQM